jgi:hypothetical protein
MGQAAQFAEAWKGYQAALKEAITSVARSCDAILVDAVGAPVPGPQTPKIYSLRGHYSEQPQHRQDDDYEIIQKPHPLPSGSRTGERSKRSYWLSGRGPPGGYEHDDKEKKLWALYN